MSCLLRVCGKEFVVDDFTCKSELPFYAIWRQGEPKTKTRMHTHSGFSLVVSDAAFDNPKQQIEDAIVFLRKHEKQLKSLQSIVEVEDMFLDFGIEEREAAIQCDHFPAQLLKLAGDLGLDLEVSRYAKASE